MHPWLSYYHTTRSNLNDIVVVEPIEHIYNQPTLWDIRTQYLVLHSNTTPTILAVIGNTRAPKEEEEEEVCRGPSSVRLVLHHLSANIILSTRYKYNMYSEINRNDHTTMTAPLPVCSAKLSIDGPG